MNVFDTDLIYFSTRVRAMKSQLLSPEQIDVLRDAGDIKMIIELLLQSPYAAQIAESLAGLHGAEAVEDAVSRNFVITLQKLRHLAKGSVLPYVEYYLLHWDLRAAKSLLRCRHHGLDAEDAMEQLIPGASLTVPRLKDLAGKESMESLVNALAVWNPDLCGGLRKKLEEYEKENNLNSMQETMDHAYFVSGVDLFRNDNQETATQLICALQIEVDRINIRTLFNYFDDDKDKMISRLLPGGTLSPLLLRRFSEAATIADAVETLGPTMYRDIVERLYEFLSDKRFSPMERMFDFFILRHFHRMAIANPVSFATFLYYTWAKYCEIRNIRFITHGRQAQIPRGRLQEELVYEMAVGARH